MMGSHKYANILAFSLPTLLCGKEAEQWGILIPV